MHRLCLIVLLAAFSGCGDNIHPMEPDAGGDPPGDPVIDAGVADAAPPDAWYAPPDAPGDGICDYMPGTFDEEISDNMANYPVRFGKGQGLEISPDIRQVGLLELENAHIGHRDVVEKRRGAVQLGDSRSATPGDVIPDADKWAIWTRNDETILQTGDSIYREQTAIGTFTWSRVGSWIQSRLRELYANTFATNVISADAAVLGDATLVAYQTTGGNAELAIYGESMGRENLQTFANSSRPRLTHAEDTIYGSYRDGATGEIFRYSWTAGQGAVVPFSTTLNTIGSATGWDHHSQRLDTGLRFTSWASYPNATTNTILVTWDAAPGAAFDNVLLSAGSTPRDAGISHWPLERAGTARIVRVIGYRDNVGPVERARVLLQDINLTTGAVTTVRDRNMPLPSTTDPIVAVHASWEAADTVWVAVEQLPVAVGSVPYVSYHRDAPASAALAATHNATSLASQGAIVAGDPAGVAPLSAGFVEQLIGNNVLTRSGWVGYVPRTGEILSRSFVGFTGDLTTRILRPPKQSFNFVDTQGSWAGPAAVPSEPSVNLRAVALCKLDRTARANKPANLDDVSISAHAGYPRFYDGITPAEHDWHTLPQIRAAASGVAGGTTTAGPHLVAVTWEADDANGLRYRSAPSFEPGTLTSGGGINTSAITVQIEPMSHTERRNVRAVVWMTTATLPGYYRAAEAAVTGAVQTIPVSILDTSLAAREQLDQAAVPLGTGIQPSQPGRVTDFVAQLVDRVASRDPRVGSLMTFTTPSRESSGFGTHWPAASNVIQEALDRDVTAALEVDGRVIMASRLGFSQLQGDGPDATGVGTFGIPLSLRAPIGIEDHTVIDRTPLGYAFGSVLGPRLLSPGLTVEDIDETVERQYSINGGHVVGVAYDQNREEIVWLDDSVQTLRLNTHNGRWASDSNRLGRDMAKRRDGTLYILRSDGKVLKQAQDVYADGAAGYSTTIAFRLRAPSRDGVAHGGFNFSGIEVFGEYLGSHAITARVYLDFRDGSVTLQGQVPAERVVANAAAGRDYRYTFYGESRFCYAARCEIELSSTTAQTARIDGIDVRYNIGTTGDSAQVDEEQRFSLDVVG